MRYGIISEWKNGGMGFDNRLHCFNPTEGARGPAAAVLWE